MARKVLGLWQGPWVFELKSMALVGFEITGLAWSLQNSAKALGYCLYRIVAATSYLQMTYNSNPKIAIISNVNGILCSIVLDY